MQSVIELLKRHRSIRKFTSAAIEESLLLQLIEAGQAASTSSFIQSVSVVRISDPELREKCAELAGNQSYVASAAEFLVFCADLNRNRERAKTASTEATDYAWFEQFIAATVDVALFAQNVVVAAESEGLGCCYIGGIRNNPQRLTDLLHLPDLVYPVFGLCLGYPDQDPSCKPRLPLSSVLHQNGYQNMNQLRRELDDYDAHVQQYYVARTNGKLAFTWSEQMAKQAATQARPHMEKYIKKQGFAKK